MVDGELIPESGMNSEILVRRRELAVRAIDAASEVLEFDISPPRLIELAEREDIDRETRLMAARTLRCIGSIAKNPKLIEAIGEEGIYPYTEGVIMYGASNHKYLELMDRFQLNPEEVTGMYALRELIKEQVNDVESPALSFTNIAAALEYIGWTVEQAANDPDGAVEQFDREGFFRDHTLTRQHDAPLFRPRLGYAIPRIVEIDEDGSVTEGIQEGLKEYFRQHPEEKEGESWLGEGNLDSFLKKLDY